MPPISEMPLSFLLDPIKYHHVDKALFDHYFSTSGFNYSLSYTHILLMFLLVQKSHCISLPPPHEPYFMCAPVTGLCHSQFHILNTLHNAGPITKYFMIK